MISDQLSFDLPARPVLGRDDFYVSPANALAVATVEMPHWPGSKLVLSGPSGAGKTHLAHVFSDTTGARILPAGALIAGLEPGEIPVLADAPLVVDGVPAIAGHAAAEATLFHLHNLTLANGHRLLMTGRAAPRDWGMHLPDLQSRVMGSHHVALEKPDDALLAAVLAKLFIDRQLAPRPDVIPYLLANMDRSFADAAYIVAALDQTNMDEKRPITRPMAARVLTGA